MELYIYNIPPYVDAEQLRERVAHSLHNNPVSARDARGRPLNFQLWLSRQDKRRRSQNSTTNNNNNDNNNTSYSQRYNHHRGTWAFARVIIPDPGYAHLLLAEVKLRPLIISPGKKLKFVRGHNKRDIPADTISRLLSIPYGGRKTIQKLQTADALWRGFPVNLIQLGTVNRNAEYVSEHTVFDITRDGVVPSSINDTPQMLQDTEFEGNRYPKRQRRNFRAPRPPRASILFDGRKKSLCLKIERDDTVTLFRMNLRTIEQISWSPSSTFSPSPPPEASSHTRRDDNSFSRRANDSGFKDNEENTDPPVYHDVLIRLTQPLIIEQTVRTTHARRRLHILPSKPHITPHCLSDIWISGPNLVSTLESMSNLYNTPHPWELPLVKSVWRRYRKKTIVLLEQKFKEMSLNLAFQYHKLLHNGVLDPVEILSCMDLLEARFQDDGEGIKIRTLQKLAADDTLLKTRIESRLQERFTPVSLDLRLGVAASQAMAPLPAYGGILEDDSFLEVLSIYITPTTMQLYGPSLERSNRILRRYKSKKECFLRVSFAEEDLGSSSFLNVNTQSYDMLAFLKARFGSAMKHGIMVAGRWYEFLAYSQSSLREGTVWFVTAFQFDGRQINAESIRQGLGDFSQIINCPARYAARLSQAFSATHRGLPIRVEDIKALKDVERNGKCFTDGVGRISPDLAKILQTHLQSTITKHKSKASAFQIRIAGCKGMVLVKPDLTGMVLGIRRSMIKFAGKGATFEIEVAEAFTSPKPFNLNRPLISILEDLGVPFEPILKLQRQAVANIYNGIRSISTAHIWLDKQGYGTAFHAPTILKMLHQHRMSFGNLPPGLAKFIQCSLTYAAIRSLRNIKYKQRINLPDCWTVVGGIDEGGTLQDSEVFICIKPEKGNTQTQWIQGPVAVTRSPQMWPGDIRLLHAIGKPNSDFLSAQTNVIIFSRKGERPAQDCMGGGDLDGDMYNVITQHQAALIPNREVPPAVYPPATKKELDRPSTIADIADFVCDYMNNDYMGVVANRWLTIADTAEHGSEDPRCKKLAELYAVAVDFPKSGTPVDIRMLPKPDSMKRPDFMVPYSEGDNPLNVYESKRFLGRLFRDIQLPTIKYTETGGQPTFVNFEFDNAPSPSRPGHPPAQYDHLAYVVAKPYLPDFARYKDPINKMANKIINDYYRHIEICSNMFKLDDDQEHLTEEECFLTMVGTPIRSPRRHEQSMGLTLYVTNFLSNLREELSRFIENLAEDDEEDKELVVELGPLAEDEDRKFAIGVCFTIWLMSRQDFEDQKFGCYTLNLIAFEGIVSNIERLDEMKEEAQASAAESVPFSRVDLTRLGSGEENASSPQEEQEDSDDEEYIT